MIVIVVIIVVVHRGLHRADPRRRSGNGVIVEEPGVEDFLQFDTAPVALHELRLRLKGADDLPDLAKLVRRDLGGLVQENDIAELHLLDDQVLDVVLVQIAPEEILGAGELVPHAQDIHHRDDAVEPRDASLDVLRSHVRDGADGTCDGLGLADAARLDDYIVELVHPDDVAELLHQVHLERTADAAVLEGDEAVVLLPDHPALLD